MSDDGMQTPGERDPLRRAFARLRQEERRDAPSFDHVMRRRDVRRPGGTRRIATLRLAAAAAAILLVAVAGPRIGRLLTSDAQGGTLAAELQRTSTMWRSPTDFLLERSHARAWRGIPAIGQPVRLLDPQRPAWRDRTDDLDTNRPGRIPS